MKYPERKVPRFQRKTVNELVCDIVKAIHYETQEETYQGQGCFTSMDRVRDTACKTNMHRYYEKFSNIFPFPVKKQHCYKVEKEEEGEEDKKMGDNNYDDPGGSRV